MSALKKKIARGTRVVRVGMRHGIAKLKRDTRDRLAAAQQALTAGGAGQAAFLLDPLVDRAGGAILLQGLFGSQVDLFDQAAAAGEPETALQAARIAWTLNPSPARGGALLGHLRTVDRFEDAEEVLAEMRRRFADNPALDLHAALLLSAKNQGDEAVETLWRYMSRRGVLSVSDRRVVSRILRAYARQCHAAGEVTTNPHPLVDPDIALAYNRDLDANIQRWKSNRFSSQLFADSVTRAQKRTDVTRRPVSHPPRVLFVTAGNWHFLTNLLERYEGPDAAVSIRTFDFTPIQDALKDEAHAAFAPQSMGVNADAIWKRIGEAEPLFAELVEWSDIIVCEWAGLHALWLSRYLPDSARLIIRLHSYEVYSQWPLFMNWGGVDGVIFVADHIRQFAKRQYDLDRLRSVQTQVVPNFNYLDRFARPKSKTAARTLGMFGYANRNKDPLFGAGVLAELAPTDPAWRLRLVGSPWKADASQRETDYRAEFDAFVEQAGIADRIDYVPFTHDLAKAFEDVGFVLSTSWREGTHESVLEGMASGAIPVIRRWPMTQPFGAPESVYPDLEYCEDPKGAAAIIQSHAEPKAFAARSDAMIDYAIRRFDMEAVLPQFEAFVNQILAHTDEKIA